MWASTQHSSRILEHSSIQRWFGFGLIARLVRPLLATRWISRITLTPSSIFLSVLPCGSCQGLQQRSGIHFLMFCTQHRSGKSPLSGHILDSFIHPSIHAFTVLVHPMCLFLSTHLQVPFLLHFTSSRCLFFSVLFHFSTDDPCSLDSPSLKHCTMWHLKTSSVPLVCVCMAEDTSQWTSPSQWTVKSFRSPVGTVLQGQEQKHREDASSRSAGFTW